jgi:hypothetical protein
VSPGSHRQCHLLLNVSPLDEEGGGIYREATIEKAGLHTQLVAPQAVGLERGDLGRGQAEVCEILTAARGWLAERYRRIVATLAKALRCARIGHEVGRHLVFQHIPRGESRITRGGRDVGMRSATIEQAVGGLAERCRIAVGTDPDGGGEIAQQVVRDVTEEGVLTVLALTEQGEHQITRIACYSHKAG